MIAAPDLSGMRSALLGLLQQSGTIQRAGAPVGTAACSVIADRTETHLPWMPPQQRIHRWCLALPWGTDVRVADRLIVTGDGTYGVEEVVVPPQGGGLYTEAYGYRLYDPAGNPVYFTANATITLSRFIKNAGTKQSTLTQVHSAVPAFIDDIGVRLKLQGIAPEFDLILVCDGAIDVHDGDRVTGYVSAATIREQVFQVQHVDHNQSLGWDYKLASMTAVS
jgi:hypothetical protein